MNITIIGGGIAGLTTAIALKRAGFDYTIFEAAPAIKAIGAGLGLGANAIRAFQHIGVAGEVMSAGRALSFFTIYDKQGKAITSTNNAAMEKKYGINNFTIHRAKLHELLLARVDNDAIFTNKRANDFNITHDGITIKFQDGSIHNAEAVIVADGIHSPIRKILLPGTAPRYAGYTCWRAVIDNTGLQLTETSETWGPAGRFGIVPLADNKIYWFACINASANDSTMKNFTAADLLEHFKDYHEPIPAILQQTPDEALLWNDIIDLEPINKYAFGNMVLIGDAAHATTPNMGQGACQAIEDAVILAAELKKNRSVELAFMAFEKRRLSRTHFVINASRSIGKIAQVENKTVASLRNTLFRMLPSWVTEKQLEKLYKVDL